MKASCLWQPQISLAGIIINVSTTICQQFIDNKVLKVELLNCSSLELLGVLLSSLFKVLTKFNKPVNIPVLIGKVE